MVVIIENLSGITAGLDWTDSNYFWSKRPISPGLIKDLGSIPGGSTFLSCSFAISEAFGRDGMIEKSLIRPGLIGLWAKNNWSPNHWTPSCDSAQILNDQ